jgi:hypothetical protein
MFLGVQLLLDGVAKQDHMLATIISARSHAEDIFVLSDCKCSYSEGQNCSSV